MGTMLVYTRVPEETLYRPALANSVHFAFSVDGKQYTPLNRNYGMLFAMGTVRENNTIAPKALAEPRIARQADGTLSHSGAADNRSRSFGTAVPAVAHGGFLHVHLSGRGGDAAADARSLAGGFRHSRHRAGQQPCGGRRACADRVFLLDRAAQHRRDRAGQGDGPLRGRRVRRARDGRVCGRFRLRKSRGLGAFRREFHPRGRNPRQGHGAAAGAGVSRSSASRATRCSFSGRECGTTFSPTTKTTTAGFIVRRAATVEGLFLHDAEQRLILDVSETLRANVLGAGISPDRRGAVYCSSRCPARCGGRSAM